MKKVHYADPNCKIVKNVGGLCMSAERMIEILKTVEDLSKPIMVSNYTEASIENAEIHKVVEHDDYIMIEII